MYSFYQQAVNYKEIRQMKNHFIFILAGGRFPFCNKTIVNCIYLAASEIAEKFLYTKKIKALFVQTIKKNQYDEKQPHAKPDHYHSYHLLLLDCLIPFY
ncbi:hypothetical protein LH29_01495 [Draconibacterium sediminis]|uniref:Uncharacterized protein n=1 Tax=Draconibacterium sediminis TaxID=1544798 RepID=A0A0D8JB78_9BACT|nr:hypothetical protein LH29_01495 [Draconibacterium sediminis]